MAALKKENLFKGGKFNRAEIMKRAWAYYKNPFSTEYRNNFKAALRAAWIDAKMVMDEMKRPKTSAFPIKGLCAADLYNSYNMRRGNACR